MIRLLLAALAVLFLAPQARAVQAVFVCSGIGDGDYIVTIAAPNTDFAQAIYVLGADTGNGGASVTPMRAAVTGSGFRYAGPGLELRGKGSTATLSDNGFEVPCDTFERASSATAPTPPSAFPKRALSLGGNVRGGLGMEFSDIGSTVQNTEILILQDTGIIMNGYTSFRIQRPGGAEGFKWGGIICAPFEPVPGVFEQCI